MNPRRSNLFDTYDLYGLQLPNRMVMSPMTRTRATEGGVPTDLGAEYYTQRATAGLIITECTQVSDQGHEIIRAPGIHRPDQIQAGATSSNAFMLLADASTARFGIAVGSRIPICAAANFRLRRLPFRPRETSFCRAGASTFRYRVRWS